MNLPNSLEKRDIFVDRKPQQHGSSGVTSHSQAPASGASAHALGSQQDAFSTSGFGSSSGSGAFMGGGLGGSGSGGALGLAAMASSFQGGSHHHQQQQFQHQSQYGASAHGVSPAPSPHATDDHEDGSDARSDDDSDVSEHPAIVIYVIDPFELALRYFGGAMSDVRRVAMLGLLKCYNELLKELSAERRCHVSLQVCKRCPHKHCDCA